MKIATFDSGILWDDPNFFWGDPSFLLEPGDPGYVPPLPPTPTKPRKPQKNRKYMASNPTPDPIGELTASGEDNRFAALGGLKAYFTANAGQENARLNVTAAIAGALYTATSDARQGAGNALTNTKNKLMARTPPKTPSARATAARSASWSRSSRPDPKWYDFGLNRPADPAQPGQPSNVHATPLGGGRVLVQIDGARRANSVNFYKKAPADTAPVKLLNTQDTQQTFEGLPAGATVAFTVTGVNDAGEGAASDPVRVMVT